MQLEERLWATTIDPVVALEEWAGRQIGSRRLVGLLTHSNAFAAFVNAAPGARELVAITKAWELGQRERWVKGMGGYDLVVLDGPASGHGVGMLRTPHTFAEIARVGPIATQARKVAALLEDPSRSAVVAVALPAELSVSETLDLEQRVAGAVGRPLDAVVVNGVLPRRFSAADVERLLSRDGQVPGPVAAAARRQHGQASTQQGQLRRLRRHTGAHVTTLPYVAAPHLGLDEVRDAGRRAGTAPVATPPARARAPRRPGSPGRGARASGRPRRRGRSPSARAARRTSTRPGCRACRASVPSQQPKKPIGIVTRPGKVSDDGEPCESGPGHTGGLRTIMTTEATMPKATPTSAPVVLKRRQVRARMSGGKFALAANDEGHAHEDRDVEAGAHEQRADDRRDAHADGGDARHLALGLLVLAAAEVGPQVVRDGARRRDDQAGHHREDGGEGRGREERQGDVAARGPLAAAEALGQQRGGQVAALADGLLGAAAQDRAGPEAHHGHERGEDGDDADRPHDRDARGLRVGDREEAHEDVRQAGACR